VSGVRALWLALALAGCGQDGAPAPASSSEALPPPPPISATAPASLVSEREVLHFTGTEPFWGGQVAGTALTYATPDDPNGTRLTVTRADDTDGLAFSGTLASKPFALAIVKGQCSDGMSDRTYPFTATLRIAGELRRGCAWSDAHPFAGPARP
jgi:uncharacterized membrane protein